MKIGIAGLGLIGGSFAKAVKAYTNHTVYAHDIDGQTLALARAEGVIDSELIPVLPEIDILLVALNPSAAIDFVRNNAHLLQNSAVVIDLCGVKAPICESLVSLAAKHGFTFVGGHPMAGLERSGYAVSRESLFKNASMILTPDSSVPADKLDFLFVFFNSLGFGTIKITSPQEHDRIIAFTSQLAHIASSSYIKSPSAPFHSGFSAGSFKDMTRVAFLNENMWSELFLYNKDNLISEIDTLISNLNDYRDAISNEDRDKLIRLLKDGKERKSACDRL